MTTITSTTTSSTFYFKCHDARGCVCVLRCGAFVSVFASGCACGCLCAAAISVSVPLCVCVVCVGGCVLFAVRCVRFVWSSLSVHPSCPVFHSVVNGSVLCRCLKALKRASAFASAAFVSLSSELGTVALALKVKAFSLQHKSTLRLRMEWHGMACNIWYEPFALPFHRSSIMHGIVWHGMASNIWACI